MEKLTIPYVVAGCYKLFKINKVCIPVRPLVRCGSMNKDGSMNYCEDCMFLIKFYRSIRWKN
jgi:hypothetical protein